MKKTTRHHIIIALMLLAAVIAMALSLPRQSGVPEYSYEVGKTWINPTLRAMFGVPIEYDSETTERITDSVKSDFIPIFDREEKTGQRQVALLAKALDSTPGISGNKQALLSMLTKIYDDGIVDNDTYDAMRSGERPQVRILEDNNVARLVDTQNMRSVRVAYEAIDSVLHVSSTMAAIRLNDYLTPNVVLNTEENDKLLRDALSSALTPKGVVQAGEAIVFNGTVVTPQKDAIIQTYTRMLQERQTLDGDDTFTLLGEVAVVAILMLVFAVFMYKMRPRIYWQMRRMVFLILFMALFVVAVFWLTKFRVNFLYMIPFAMVPIIITTFYDARTSFFTHMVVVLICSLVATHQADFIIMQFLAGGIAIVSIQELTKRSQLVLCAFFIFLAYVISHTALTFVRGGSPSSLGWYFPMYFAINSVVLSFAYIVIFLVEKAFGFTSTVTLVELCDINTPVLRQLAESCPGTFQHSLQVANIASEAALKIQANMQLVRAGALYHDIGKIDNPAFFTENQSGVNPHDALEPQQSARIVIQHVTDGIKRAEKARLPQVLRDLIAQHHGKGITRYFYAQDCKAHPGQEIDRGPYSYPGPNPQTKEAAILMMADACEAAAKSLKEHDENSLRATINRVVDNQIADGLLRESNISFRDVETVKRIFLQRLCAFYYTRISYPDDVKPAIINDEHDDTDD